MFHTGMIAPMYNPRTKEVKEGGNLDFEASLGCLNMKLSKIKQSKVSSSDKWPRSQKDSG